jgi:poly(A) polymerase
VEQKNGIEGFENHEHWSAVKGVCQQLAQSGYQALLAGGCVRDLLMGRKPNDFDIATNATPDQVEALWPRAVLVGKAFGVIILPFEGFQVEVATFRQDLEYRDGRRPEGVRFSTPEEDAKRRDFTVNALFYDLAKNTVVDYVNGRVDIASKVIRTVGLPELRFGEDKLRILRAVRFAAQLDFSIEAETYAVIVRLRTEVTQVSRERVRDELLKLLKAPRRSKGLELLLETGLLEVLFTELALKLRPGLEREWLARLARIDCRDQAASLAAFFAPLFTSGSATEFRDRQLKALKLDSKQIEAVLFALKNEVRFQKPESIRVGELAILLSNPSSPSAQSFAFSGLVDGGQSAAVSLDALAKRALTRDEANGALSLPEAFLSGEDAKAVGMTPGPELGRALHEAFLLQLEGQLSDRSAALTWLKSAPRETKR